MTTTTAGAVIDRMCERLIGHHILWKLTAQMSENVYCVLVHAMRSENFNTSFDTMKNQGNCAYIVLFGDTYQEISRELFGYLRDKLEGDMKRNDERQGGLLVSEEDSARINNGDQVKGSKKRKITQNSCIKIAQPNFDQ